MKNLIIEQRPTGLSILWKIVLIVLLIVFIRLETVNAQMKAPPPEKINAIIIGDRVVNIAFRLGVIPTAMSVRGSLWPMTKELKTASQLLGCPNCIIKNSNIVPDTVLKYGIKRVILEKSEPYCLYKPKVKPENALKLLKGLDVAIETVDFTKGLKSAIRQTAKLINREAKGDLLIKQYNKALKEAKKMLPVEKSGKKAIIINGTMQSSTGRYMLRVEAPGGYSDRFLLEPLGYVNAGDAFKRGNAKPKKGYYMVKKNRKGSVLDPLLKANPDTIVMTGNAFAVQKALADYRKHHPELSDLNAFKSMRLFALPVYVDSGMVDYPRILKKWAVALSQ